MFLAATCRGQTIYVDSDAPGNNNGTSWVDAYNYLQDALADANSNPDVNEIWVAQGTYTPDTNSTDPNGSGDREATFQLKNGVIMQGGYAGFGEPDPNARDTRVYETVLSGDLDSNDVGGLNDLSRNENSFHVVTGSGTGATAVLDGFIITAGNGAEGAGMFNYPGSPTLTDCVFTRNSVAYYGAGMFNVDSSPTLINCVFTGNSGGGGGGGMCNMSNSNPVLSDCIFSGNLLKYIYITGGGGGGMYNYGNSSPTLVNCTFIGNRAVNCGGAISNFESSSPTLTNCTFVGNHALFHDVRAIYNWWGNCCPMLTNCILWDGGNEVESMLGSTISITYSDVQGGWPGLGNIDVDPCFVEPGYWDPNGTPEDANDDFWVDGDYHLYPFSLCINAGDPNYLPEPNETDLDGNPRIIAGRIDMGAYEANHIHTRLWMFPRLIHRYNRRQRRISAWLRLPLGITKDQIDSNTPLLLYPGEIEAERQYVFQRRGRGPKRTSVFAFFDKAELMEVVPDGRVELRVVGMLKTGQYFYGSNTIRIKRRHRP